MLHVRFRRSGPLRMDGGGEFGSGLEVKERVRHAGVQILGIAHPTVYEATTETRLAASTANRPSGLFGDTGRPLRGPLRAFGAPNYVVIRISRGADKRTVGAAITYQAHSAGNLGGALLLSTGGLEGSLHSRRGRA